MSYEPSGEMSFCDKESEASPQRRAVSVDAPSDSPVFLAPRTPVVFSGTGPYLVEGSHSGEEYYFSPRHAEQLIDAADAAVLIKTGLFRKNTVTEQIAALVPVTLQSSEAASQHLQIQSPEDQG